MRCRTYFIKMSKICFTAHFFHYVLLQFFFFFFVALNKTLRQMILFTFVENNLWFLEFSFFSFSSKKTYIDNFLRCSWKLHYDFLLLWIPLIESNFLHFIELVTSLITFWCGWVFSFAYLLVTGTLLKENGKFVWIDWLLQLPTEK